MTVKGWFLFAKKIGRSDMRMLDYTSWADYFRVHKDKLQPVFEVHCDHDDDILHPVCHSQIATMENFVVHVNDAWHLGFGVQSNQTSSW